MTIKPELTILIDDNSKEKEYFEFFSLKYNTKIILKDACLESDNLDLLIISKDTKGITPNKHLGISSLRYVPTIGINDGAICLAEIAGCDILYDVQNHMLEHTTSIEATNPFGRNIVTTTTPSNHNKLISPFNLKKSSYSILGWSKYYKSDCYLNKNDENVKLDSKFLEVEIIEFTSYNFLAIQFEITKIAHVSDKECVLGIINKFITKY